MELDDFERRKLFRHSVKPPKIILARVFLEDGELDGKIIDLSMGGLAVLLNEWTDSQCTSCAVRFRLPNAPLVFDLNASVIHRESCAEGLVWGLNFTDIENMHKNLEHTVLYRFLVAAFHRQRPGVL